MAGPKFGALWSQGLAGGLYGGGSTGTTDISADLDPERTSSGAGRRNDKDRREATGFLIHYPPPAYIDYGNATHVARGKPLAVTTGRCRFKRPMAESRHGPWHYSVGRRANTGHRRYPAMAGIRDWSVLRFFLGAGSDLSGSGVFWLALSLQNCALHIFVFRLECFCRSAIGFWTIPWLQRYFGISAMEVGTVLGLSYAVVGQIGMILGGVLADRLRQRVQRGKLYITLCTSLLGLLAALLMLSAENVFVAYIATISFVLVGTIGTAPVSSTVSDLMIPRTRAIAMALLILFMNFIGVALGPYCVGLLSDSLTAAGTDSGEALRYSMQLALIISGISIVFLLLAVKHIVSDEDSLLARARALGEDI